MVNKTFLLSIYLLFLMLESSESFSRFAFFNPQVLCDEFYKPKYCPDIVTLESLKSVEEFEDCAPSLFPLHVRNYIWGLTGRGVTFMRNFDAYKKIAIEPRMLRDVSSADISTTVLGRKIAVPFGLSPTAAHGMASPEAEVATARGFASVGGVMVLNCLSNKNIEDVARAARSVRNGPPYALWMQTYIFKKRSETMSNVRRAERAGFHAIVVTSDSPVIPTRSCNDTIPDLPFPNLTDGGATEVVSNTYDDLRWLVHNTRLPVIPKGLFTGEGARMALRAGAAAIFVSNHGGRALDGDEAAIDALPKVMDALRNYYPQPEVYVDGGVRNGYDVYKALARGARAVFIGRPTLYGLAVGGAKGVEKVLTIIKEEFNETMILAGRKNVEEVRPATLIPKMPPLQTPTRRLTTPISRIPSTGLPPAQPPFETNN